MIIIKVFQGLGNQLFQYALVRSLEELHGKTIKLDTTWYGKNSNHRPFGLDKFQTKYLEATNEEIYNVKNGVFRNRIINFIFNQSLKFKKYYHQPYFKEDLTALDKNILKINSRTYIEGYFSSEYFFKNIRSKLLIELELKGLPDSKNSEIISKMKNQESVCLSVRRGDFLNSMHNVCRLTYFCNAIEWIKTKLSNPVFYIFSDDNKWVIENLVFDKEHYFITHNFPNFYEDFRLMKSCKHHIIPNSTFSWWAAWLGDYENKIVIAPEKWLDSDEIDYSYFVPSEWIKIDN
jgi:hypothetical protein